LLRASQRGGKPILDPYKKRPDLGVLRRRAGHMIPAVPPARAAEPAGRPMPLHRRLRRRLDSAVTAGRFVVLPWLQSYWRGRDLEHQSGVAEPRRRRGIVAVVPFYGDNRLLNGFLRYHRRLGVDEFMLLDFFRGGRAGGTPGLGARLRGVGSRSDKAYRVDGAFPAPANDAFVRNL
jgi:hypothetical protein